MRIMKEIKYIYVDNYIMAAVAKLKCPFKLEYSPQVWK